MICGGAIGHNGYPAKPNLFEVLELSDLRSMKAATAEWARQRLTSAETLKSEGARIHQVLGVHLRFY